VPTTATLALTLAFDRASRATQPAFEFVARLATVNDVELRNASS
jgi:hypothetical protein